MHSPDVLKAAKNQQRTNSLVPAFFLYHQVGHHNMSRRDFLVHSRSLHLHVQKANYLRQCSMEVGEHGKAPVLSAAALLSPKKPDHLQTVCGTFWHAQRFKRVMTAMADSRICALAPKKPLVV